MVVKKAQEIKNIEISSLKRRETNERRTNKGKEFVSERKKQIVGTVFQYDNRDDKRKTGSDK